jgi:hypothetical protein
MKKILTLFLVFALVASFAMAKVDKVDKLDVPDDKNPHCADIGDYDNELKIDPPISGEYDGITFTLANDLQYFDWSSTFPIDAVIAKGGDDANIYYYDPAELSGTGLVSPLNGGGQIPALSHAVFCWNDRENEVPEFGVVAAAVAMIGAVAVFAIRRKN